MAEGSKEEEGSGGRECEGAADRARWKLRPANASSFFPSLVHFSLSAFLVLVVAGFFQAQVASLREELSAVRAEVCSRTASRVLRKRSPVDGGSRQRRGSDIQTAHLEGSLPLQHIQKQGRIGPWILLSSQESFVRLRGKSTEVEISEGGIYYIYAQVYYLTSQPHNSYQVLSYNGTEEPKNHRNVATCSSQGRNSVGEVSCYTGLVVSLNRGQRLYLNQVEQDRVIHFSNGCSYFGLVLLKKNAALKEKK